MDANLDKHGYKCWDTSHDTYSNIQITTNKWQRRIDFEYPDIPVCELNDKLFINITESISTIQKNKFSTYEISITPEVDDFNIALKFYSINEDKFNEIGIKEWEKRLVSLWKLSYELNKDTSTNTN